MEASKVQHLLTWARLVVFTMLTRSNLALLRRQNNRMMEAHNMKTLPRMWRVMITWLGQLWLISDLQPKLFRRRV